jgi:hypothetical protein
MRHDDAGDGGSATMALIRFAMVSQFSVVLSGLPTFTICPTVTVANSLIGNSVHQILAEDGATPVVR